MRLVRVKFPYPVKHVWVGPTRAFSNGRDETEVLSTAVVTAVAQVHNEEVLNQQWPGHQHRGAQRALPGAEPQDDPLV
jgi:hypothetical protein